MIQIRMWLILYHSSRLCKKVWKLPLGSATGLSWVSGIMLHFSVSQVIHENIWMWCWHTSRELAVEKPWALRMWNHYYKWLFTGWEEYSAWIEYSVNRAAYNKTSHQYWKGWGRKIRKVKLHLYSFSLYPNFKHVLSELLRNGLWMENKQSNVR